MRKSKTEKLNNKLRDLIIKQKGTTTDHIENDTQPETIKNLTNKTFTEGEQELLKKGLKFALPPK